MISIPIIISKHEDECVEANFYPHSTHLLLESPDGSVILAFSGEELQRLDEAIVTFLNRKNK